MASVSATLIESTFDAFDAQRAGSIALGDADSALTALGVDRTRQQIVAALNAKVTEDAIGRKKIARADFVAIAAEMGPAPFSAPDRFAAFAVLDGVSSARISPQALEAAAKTPYFTAADQRNAHKACGTWSQYPAKGLALDEWNNMLDALEATNRRRPTKV